VAAIVAVAAAARMLPDLRRDRRHGVVRYDGGELELRLPEGWHESPSPPFALVITDDTVRASFSRLAWSDAEFVQEFLGCCPQFPVRENAAAYLIYALGLDMEAAGARVERARLAGRRATLVVAPRRPEWTAGLGVASGGWHALVVAPGPDLLYAQAWAATANQLEGTWPRWLSIVRSLRLTRRDAIEAFIEVPPGAVAADGSQKNPASPGVDW
jgi:hypothetical protein